MSLTTYPAIPDNRGPVVRSAPENRHSSVNIVKRAVESHDPGVRFDTSEEVVPIDGHDDPNDTNEAAVRPQADGTVNVDGTVPIRDLNRQMDWDLPDEEATTIAGLVIHEAQTIPEPGQIFTFHGYRFEILRKTRNKITALRVKPLPDPQVEAGRAQDRPVIDAG